MGKVLEEISDKESRFIAESKVFFVATAPLSSEHHVSVSPKAPGNSCVVLSAHEVAYADLTGSGAETAAHVLQNGRMTLLFCNLERGAPQILRLHGKAELILAARVPATLLAKFPHHITSHIGFRAVYRLKVHRISTSCGYSLPQMDFVKYRSTLDEYTEKAGKAGMFDYVTKKNSYSIDGLPSLALLREDGPMHVEPVVEDGYIFGNVVVDNVCSSLPTPASVTSNALAEARKMHARGRTNCQSSGMAAVWARFVVLVMTFATGVLVGLYCAPVYKA
jgi:Pyridoxamine 5'-phosphate oxidase